MGTLLRSATRFFQRDSIASAVDATQAGDTHSSKTSPSPFWIRRENVILRRHLGMAREPAFGTAWIKFGGLKRIGRRIISPLGIGPSVGVRESLSLGLAGWPGQKIATNCIFLRLVVSLRAPGSLFHNSDTGAKNAINLIAAILYGVDRTVSGPMCSPITGRAIRPLPNNRSTRCGAAGLRLRCCPLRAGALRPRQ